MNFDRRMDIDQPSSGNKRGLNTSYSFSWRMSKFYQTTSMRIKRKCIHILYRSILILKNNFKLDLTVVGTVGRQKSQPAFFESYERIELMTNRNRIYAVLNIYQIRPPRLIIAVHLMSIASTSIFKQLAGIQFHMLHK